MKQNGITNNVQVTLAPWVEEYFKSYAEQKRDFKVAAPIMDDDYHEKEHRNHNPTDPIRSLDDIERLKNYFLTKKGRMNTNIRDYAYFVFSLNVSRRAGDVLALHVSDILNPDGSFKKHINIIEQKTLKPAFILLNTKAKEALTMYFNSLKTYNMSDWLFPNTKDHSKPMTVDGMRRMLQRAAKALDLDMHMGTHSLRKTNPYHIISNSNNTADEVMTSQFLNHNDIKTTYHYIRRSQDEMDQFVESHGL